MFCGKETGSRIEVAMTLMEFTSFIDSIKVDYEAVNRMLAVVDVRTSEAWNPEDRRLIFEAVERGAGFEAINAAVMSEMRGCVITMVDRALGEVQVGGGSGEEEMATLQYLKGRLLQDQPRAIRFCSSSLHRLFVFQKASLRTRARANLGCTVPTRFAVQGSRLLCRGRAFAYRLLGHATTSITTR